jgi:hypothetical protein
MFDPKLTSPHETPLFYRKKILASGEGDEVSLGSSAASIIRWIIAAILVVLFIMLGKSDPSSALGLLFKSL